MTSDGPTTTHTSYCRICQASCGVLVQVRSGRIVKITGDRDNAVSQGFTCPKGRRGGDFHHGPGRLRTSLRRTASGEFEPVAAPTAAAEIADRLRAIIDEHGPESVGLFMGTQGNFATLTSPFASAWFRGLRSHKLFSTMTIDQSAKWVVPGRMGQYLGGRQRFADADVWLLAGTNPLVSVNGGIGDGELMHDPSAQLRAARRRGLKLIVIDPRRTETAAKADLHLQPRPGHDALLFAGLLRVVLSEGLHDAEFCDRYVTCLDELRAAVDGATAAVVERVCGVPAADVVDAARLFGGRRPDGTPRRGMALSGTGVCMGPHSNLAEHLVTCLNVVCGRYLREGEAIGMQAVLGPTPRPRAQVVAANRSWERGFHSRIGGVGQLYGQLPSGILADEILEPGPDRIRAMIVSGGNPVSALPDSERVARAFGSLDLLVTIDPRLSDTALLADYVIAPVLAYERADHTASMEGVFPVPFAQYTPPVVDAPPGVVEDWRFFLDLAAAMGLPMRVAGTDLDPTTPPEAAELLARFAGRGRVGLDQVRAAPHGLVAEPGTAVVAPPEPGTEGNRLTLLPDDVAAELAAVLASELVVAARSDRATVAATVGAETVGAETGGEAYPYRLVVRRMREVMNSLGRDVDGLPRRPYNPAFLHPSDLAALGVAEGALVEVTSAHGSLLGVAHADDTMRPGVLSMSHGWGLVGDVPVSPWRGGSNVNLLLTQRGDTEDINRMPLMSAVPVRIEAVRTMSELGSGAT